MTVTSEARRHYERRQALAARTARQAAAAWRNLDTANRTASFQIEVLPRLQQLLTAAQVASATMTDPYLDRVLRAQGLDIDGLEVNTAAFAGTASDGRPLATLLASPIIDTEIRLRRGEGLERSLRSGLFTLERIIRTQVQDAGRAADGAAAVGRHRVTGYYRYLSPPSCDRCAVLAGKFYRVNTGFLRHPRCDCVHVPGAKDTAEDARTDPRTYFESLTESQQNKLFTNAGAEAIRDGADIGQVVNARRGMTAAGTTTEGTTRRGFAGKRLGADTRSTGSRFGATTAARARSTPRLMPEEIYRIAPTRAEARNLLVAHGYLF